MIFILITRQFKCKFVVKSEILRFVFSIQERIAMSSLQGLPPLPRSLSGFNLSGRGESGEPPPPPTRSSSKSQRGGKPSSSRPSPPARQLTTLDTQLAVLRREMVLYSRIVCARFFSPALSQRPGMRSPYSALWKTQPPRCYYIFLCEMHNSCRGGFM